MLKKCPKLATHPKSTPKACSITPKYNKKLIKKEQTQRNRSISLKE
jgi:hypothetical protein